MKTGLILEGGAMRGLFTAGVMDVMMENGITYDGAVGVSAGAAFGCNYKSGQIGRVIRYKTAYIRDKHYCGMGVLLRTGNYYSTDFCYGRVPYELDPFDFAAYEQNPMEFYVVATDILTGEAVYHKYEGREESGFDWIRASASMPLVSKNVEIDGRLLLDGGIADSIPVRFFESIGYTRNVAVLTRPRDYRKSPGSMQSLIKLKYRRYPKLVEAMANRHTVYNETLDYIAAREEQGALFVIRPDAPLPVSQTERDPKKLRTAYEIGRETATRQLPALQNFLMRAE